MIFRFKSILLICSTVFIFSSCLLDEEDSPAPSETFVKYYGEVGEQRVTDLLVNEQGNIVIFGTQRLSSADARQTFYLIEADSLGNQIGTGTVLDPGSAGILDSIVSVTSSVIKETDDGYLIIGNAAFTDGSNLSDEFIFWARLGRDLQLLNENSWDTISSLGLGSEVSMSGNDILLSNDGNVIIAGSTFYPQPNDPYEAGQQQNLLVKKTLDGDSTIWRRSDGRPNFRDELIKVFESASGDIAVIGTTNRSGSNGEGGLNVSYLLYNREGLSQVGISSRVGMSIQENSSADDTPYDIFGFFGGIKVVGTSRLGNISRPFVMVFQGTNVQKSIVEPDNENHNTTGFTITQTRTGDLIVAGQNSTIQNGDIYIAKTSAIGQRRPEYAENTYGITSGADAAKASATLPDGSILIASDVDFGSGQIMIGLLKINDEVELQQQ